MTDRIEKARFAVEQACGRMEDQGGYKEFDRCLDDFAAAVREDERERCYVAAVASAPHAGCGCGECVGADAAAKAIRARGEP